MESSEEIEERAAAWLAHRDSGDWTEEDQRKLEDWLAASTRNEVAFIRLESVWDQALRMKALAAGTPAGEVPSRDAWNHSPFFDNAGTIPEAPETTPAPSARRRTWLWQALAATILLATAAGVVRYLEPTGRTFRTAVGGVTFVPMRDGSKVTLNTDSTIRIALTETERRVDLEQGEAFFEVAKDPKRPFIVRAGNKRVIAVGTQFSVRRVDDDIRVFVTEGKVRVESEPLTPDVPVAASGSAEPVISAGGIARTKGAGVLVQDQKLSEVQDYLSWRSGYLVFHETALADAVAEFNRYNEQKIVIEDPEVAAVRLSGKFQANRFEAFVRLLEEGFPIRAQAEDDRIVLTYQRAH